MTNRPRNASLDGVRAVAIGVVLLFHGGSSWFVGGHVGVDVFFVLSGFLITRSLLTERGPGPQRLDLLGFWRRRALRLLPAAVTCVVVTSAVMALVSAPSQRPPLRDDAWAGLAYFANWRFLHQNNAYFRHGLELSPYLHLWSLSVEEQFYIAFPLVLLLVLWVARRSRRLSLPVVLPGVLAVAVGWSLWLSANASADRVFYGTDAHAYQLLAGAVLSVWVARLGDAVIFRAARRRWPWGVLAVAGVLGVVLLTVLAPWDPYWRGFAATWCAVATVAGVSLGDGPLGAGPLGAGRSAVGSAAVGSGAVGSVATGSLVNRMLGWRPAATLGLISYGVYLWHWPIIALVDRTWVVDDFTRTTVSTFGAVVIAYFSWHAFEAPIIRRGRLMAWRGPVAATSLVAAAALSVAAGALVVGQLYEHVAVARSAAAVSVPVPGYAIATPVPGDLGKGVVVPMSTEGSCTEVAISSPTTDCRVTQGAERVLLLGDSHAGGWQWVMNPLAETVGWELSVVVAAACPWQPGLVYQGRHSAVCGSVHAAIEGEWFDRLDPELVIVAGRPLTEPGPRWNLQDVSGAPVTDRAALMEAGTRAALAALTRNGARVVIIEPRPSAPFDVQACLEVVAMVEECAFAASAEAASESEWLAQLAQELPGVTAVPTIDLICPRYPTCDAVVAGRMVRTDTDHLWPGFMQDIVPYLLRRMALGDTTDLTGVRVPTHPVRHGSRDRA